jgi:alpha-1,2-mannosyltransferase
VYPLAAACGARVACYTHYPMVSSDMLRAVAARAPAFNNAPTVARSRLLSAAKLAYYRALGAAYGAAGRCAQCSMVNSSWTGDHISELWGVEPLCVFPPVDTAALRSLPLARPASPLRVVSVAQFRPEKAHAAQLRAWAALRGVRADARAAAGDAAGAAALRGAQLLLLGGVRHAGDAARLEGLRMLADSLNLGDSVRFAVGVPAPELHAALGAAHAGLHTMRDEHFGISVVEYMAAGAVPVAHNSAGPAADIVVPSAPGAPRPGRLADTEDGFAAALEEVLLMPEAERRALAAAARLSAGRFSEDAFAAALIAALRRVLPHGGGGAPPAGAGKQD